MKMENVSPHLTLCKDIEITADYGKQRLVAIIEREIFNDLTGSTFTDSQRLDLAKNNLSFISGIMERKYLGGTSKPESLHSSVIHRIKVELEDLQNGFIS